MSRNEQLSLELTAQGIGPPRPGTVPVRDIPKGLAPASADLAHDSFLRFAQTCARIGAGSRKLEKVRILAEYLRQLGGDSLALAATWFTGRPFAASQNKVLQLGWALLRDALCAVAQVDEPAFHEIYLKYSDLGETAAAVLERRPASPSLSLADIDAIFNQLLAARGPLAKAPIVRDALARCTALEAKFLIKIITGELRIGLKEGLVEESIAAAFSKPPEEVRRANLLVGDIGQTARLAAADQLSQTALVPFQPLKCMLATPEETAADVWERVQQGAAGVRPQSQTRADNAGRARDDHASVLRTVWLENKYDGIRCQLHKVGRRVALYSRDLKDITAAFPEVVERVSGWMPDFILDGEMLAMRGREVLPFADLQKRLGRREADLFMHEEVPVAYMAFDCLWAGGETLVHRPLRERRAALERLGPPLSGLQVAPVSQAASAAEIERAFESARARGNEGLMIKDPASPYTPGRRGLAWLKLKKALATLDCVVVGAEYGHGKRSQVLSDYTFAVRDESSGDLKIIGKAYTGLTDVEIAGLTEHFLKTALRCHGRYFEVRPDTVLEIAFDRLQPSGRHNSGLAMRFPRIVRIRTDKPLAEIDTLETARKLVKM